MKTLGRIARGTLVIFGLGFVVLGLLITVGAIGRADVMGLAVSGFGAFVAFVAWTRMWDEFINGLGPWS